MCAYNEQVGMPEATKQRAPGSSGPLSLARNIDPPPQPTRAASVPASKAIKLSRLIRFYYRSAKSSSRPTAVGFRFEAALSSAV